MTRMLGYLANQSDRVRCAVSQEVDALRFGAGADAWGIGSFQSGEVLLRRRPVLGGGGAHLPEMVRDLRTGALVACARRFGPAARLQENIPPFRFRQWVCAVDGETDALASSCDALHAAVPEFLARNIRGTGADERLAHLLFASLHAEGRLDDPDLDRGTLAGCVREAVSRADAITRSPVALSLLATNGRVMVALARGVPLCWVRRQGVRDAAACAAAEAVDGRGGRRIDPESLRHLRYVMVASGEEVKGFQPLAPSESGSVVAVDRNLDVLVESA